jgi:MarR family transcriptional regulator for hemolysin
VPTPPQLPIGLAVTRAAKTLSQAFEARLAAEGGSLPVWLVLLAVKSDGGATQRALADQLGLRQPTLTHHLHAMEASGLITRERDPANRRAQRITLTDEGEALFRRLRDVAVRFDRRLRTGLDDDRVAELREVLDRLAANVTGD